jgi:hypothetical protein
LLLRELLILLILLLVLLGGACLRLHRGRKGKGRKDEQCE